MTRQHSQQATPTRERDLARGQAKPVLVLCIAVIATLGVGRSWAGESAGIDCPLRNAPFSVDMPLLDILLSPTALAAADKVVPGLSGRIPANRFPTTAPSMGAIMSLRQIAGMGMATPEQVAALEAELAKLPVSGSDSEARCARYDADQPPLEVPDRPVRVLVFDKINGFDHGPSVAAATAAVRTLAERAGWGVAVTGSGGAFTPENLAQFDVVVWNNNSGDVLTLSQRAAFEAYIGGGGGYLGLHGAGGDSIYLWDWYVDTLLGARFIGHPMQPQFQDAALHVEKHPDGIGAALQPGWTMNDEWYSFRESPRGHGAQVIATLDEATYKQVGFGGQDLRMGDDHPIAWTNCVGAGRALYTAVGHRAEVYADDRYMQLLGESLAWAAGQGDGCRGE